MWADNRYEGQDWVFLATIPSAEGIDSTLVLSFTETNKCGAMCREGVLTQQREIPDRLI